MKLTKRLAKMYQVDVTNLASLEHYEKLGWDVSEFKDAALAQAAAKENARQLNDQMHPVDLSRLDPFVATPRDPNSAFVTDALAVGAYGGLFANKDKKRQIVAGAPLIYGAVVEANSDLWEPGSGTNLPAVFVIATDAAHRTNIEWLTQAAQTIAALKHQGDLPKDMRKLIDDLRNSISYFCHKIGPSVAGDADAWCATTSFNQANLPGKRLPRIGEVGMLPFLLKEEPKENQFLPVENIPAKYYSD